MAKRVQSAEDKLVVALAILSVAFCLRVSEAASVRGIDLDQSDAYVRFYDFKTKDRWIKRPAGSYVCRLIGLSGSGWRYKAGVHNYPFSKEEPRSSRRQWPGYSAK